MTEKSKFINFHQSLIPENHFIELAGGCWIGNNKFLKIREFKVTQRSF